ncbi:hypothetical protein D9758_004631 [Tetrapyrgos nigripes]|uniref:Uncharacterized protein n=1 Tax=Tetrapyrgos nigripes TaxID=182062 RepID=A0A8H5GZQ0_9AGAR|nr:hypothetical protein D9758_004631 [Tetrapyrgos nigripes]
MSGPTSRRLQATQCRQTSLVPAHRCLSRTPGLQSLHVDHPLGEVDPPPPLSLPPRDNTETIVQSSLQYFFMNGSNGTFLREISLPNLQDFRITDINEPEPAPDLCLHVRSFIMRSRCTLTTLNLCSIVLNDNLLALLMATPTVSALKISLEEIEDPATQMASGFLSFLTVATEQHEQTGTMSQSSSEASPQSPSESPPVLPKLKDLQLHLDYALPHFSSQQFINMLQSRRDASEESGVTRLERVNILFLGPGASRLCRERGLQCICLSSFWWPR